MYLSKKVCRRVKFRCCEKAKKFEITSHIFCSVNPKQSETFFPDCCGGFCGCLFVGVPGEVKDDVEFGRGG